MEERRAVKMTDIEQIILLGDKVLDEVTMNLCFYDSNGVPLLVEVYKCNAPLKRVPLYQITQSMPIKSTNFDKKKLVVFLYLTITPPHKLIINRKNSIYQNLRSRPC